MSSKNIITFTKLILQKKGLQIMNFKDHLFQSNPLFSTNNILKFGNKITLRESACWSVKTILINQLFRPKYGHFRIRANSWNSIKETLWKNFIKDLLTKYLIFTEIRFYEFHKFWLISPKLVPRKINRKLSIQEIGKI